MIQSVPLHSKRADLIKPDKSLRFSFFGRENDISDSSVGDNSVRKQYGGVVG